MPKDITFDAYIAHIAAVDKAKSLSYVKGRKQALFGKLKTVLSCFPKCGEFFLRHVRSIVSKLSNRPRNICCPDISLLGLANHINFIGLKCLKKVFPAYTSYLNNEEL